MSANGLSEEAAIYLCMRREVSRMVRTGNVHAPEFDAYLREIELFERSCRDGDTWAEIYERAGVAT